MYYYGYGYGGGADMLLFLALAVMVLGLVAQSRVTRVYKKYSSERASSGITAAQMAHNLLRNAGSSVQVAQVAGQLTDNYNPQTGVVSLSQSTYSSSSIAALAVAAHEIGHVLQYQEGYTPIKIRNTILPVASIGSSAAPWLVLLGVFMGSYNLAMLGVWLFLGILVFQFVTLPVEFNASRRAIALLEDGGYISYDQRSGASAVLRAAAMTYVVATLSALVSFLRLFLMAKSARRRD